MANQNIQIEHIDALLTPAALVCLPTYEEATGRPPRVEAPFGRLPSYKKTRSTRYHPYKRFTEDIRDETDGFMNIIFDPEYEKFVVPPALPSRRLVISQSFPEFEDSVEQRLNAIIFAERARQVNMTIMANDFLAAFGGNRF